MSDQAGFAFATCQVGAEGALKQELGRERPAWRLAFSRPGFATFKLPAEAPATAVESFRAVFARTAGVSLGAVAGETDDARAEAVAHAAIAGKFDAVHVWQRDLAAPGHRGYAPGLSDAARTACEHVRQKLPADAPVSFDAAQSGQRVLDCVLLEPDRWWLGWHRAEDVPSCWVGGFYPIAPPPEMVSRAWLKVEEALAWSGLPVQPGHVCAEIGCAPGGAAQALLARGLAVLGIDPAQVDPRVAEHPQFTHVRKRGHEVRRREFRKVRWLLADLNVPPHETLDTVEGIVTHAEVNVRGLLLTLKLADWQLAAELPQWLARVRGWGYPLVQARQLHHNRQEVCLAAQRRPKRR
jgi:23S rRNA (cytidine2498-2'-O)-methyltransferase